MQVNINGSTIAIKKEMKALRSEVLKQIKDLEKKYEEAYMPPNEKRQYDFLTTKAENLKVPDMLPVRLESGLIVNYRLFDRFMKKLKGFEASFEEKEDHLKIVYAKGGTRGTFVMNDLSKLLSGTASIPEGELKVGEKV